MTTLTLVKKTSFTVASLATTMLLGICPPVRAFMFGTGGIQFEQDTKINFKFNKSVSPYQSSLWVAQAEPENNGYTNIARLFYETKASDNGSANNWEGTFGNAVTSENGSITQTFTFLQDKIYALLLWSDTGSGKPFEQSVFGDFKLDYNSSDSFANIHGGKGPEQFSSLTKEQLAKGTTRISFDDAKKGTQLDFKDFTVSAELAPEPVPEPVTVFGTMLGIGALAATRRKKKRGQEP
jgi:hypothetical protein